MGTPNRWRSPRSLALVAVVLAVILIGVVWPEIRLASVRNALSTTVCGGDTPAPPRETTLAAIERADRLSVFPTTAGRASRLSSEAAVTCLQSYADACDALRDPAVDAAREALRVRLLDEGSGEGPSEAATDWETHVDTAAADTLCSAWAPWRAWLVEEGLDVDAACAVCAL